MSGEWITCSHCNEKFAGPDYLKHLDDLQDVFDAQMDSIWG